MKKYGYNLEMEMLNDKTFIGYRSGLIYVNAITLVVLLMFNSITYSV